MLITVINFLYLDFLVYMYWILKGIFSAPILAGLMFFGFVEYLNNLMKKKKSCSTFLLVADCKLLKLFEIVHFINC